MVVLLKANEKKNKVKICNFQKLCGLPQKKAVHNYTIQLLKLREITVAVKLYFNMEQLDRDEILKKKYLARGPGDAATKAYIASKYLSSDDSSKKKRKKKSSSSSRQTKKVGNIGIIDEEDSGWQTVADQESESRKQKREQEKLEEEAISNAGGVFRGTSSNWETIREGEVEEQVESDEEPVIVQKQEEFYPRMSNGQRAGLLTKAEIKIEAEKAREAEKRAMERLKKESPGENEETVYRDASGRKVDLKLKRAEEAKLRKEEIEKESRRMEWGKGLVQRKEAEEQKRRLNEEKHKPMAR